MWSFSPFRWITEEGLLSVTSESLCMKYWLTACSSLPRKKVWSGVLTVPPCPYLLTLDVKQKNKQANSKLTWTYKRNRFLNFVICFCFCPEMIKNAYIFQLFTSALMATVICLLLANFSYFLVKKYYEGWSISSSLTWYLCNQQYNMPENCTKW